MVGGNLTRSAFFSRPGAEGLMGERSAIADGSARSLISLAKGGNPAPEQGHAETLKFSAGLQPVLLGFRHVQYSSIQKLEGIIRALRLHVQVPSLLVSHQ